MDPIAFSIFGIDIRWYGILISMAMVIGIFIALNGAKRAKIDEDRLLDLYLIAIPSSIIGARVYYVLFNLEYYKGDLFKIINIRSGGLAIHGGIIGGLIAGYIYCKLKNIDFRKVIDISAPGIILGQAIGRWGNFFNQEAYGRPTDLPWAITIDGVKVHPTFFYEFVWNICVFIFLIKFRKNKKYEGQIFIYYAIGYSIGRFFIEGLRIDSLMIGPFKTAQLVSLLTITGCIFLDRYFQKHDVRREKNEF
ncbi:phosphatidylglycerol:prolipoprotein diacylglycerol transferase [Alkalithermobacter thermoalcaliphilus JW-YL-7 = DSM 7308]|uniref:Phosphatidylglycerol--prolipoprotein diacylglyceryl transferase n=1 Tax=Alkalithermobacter thermoalcaliphilus JW-YL-7 = DSM 7308 TaxID=1121328 RepID=A0A150FPJ0_CLOPD|nr:Prolipoprotein diacylglyceryl transferase [[Clostridium] paradoxum JW-YL-7 = DSM 7308]SHK98819.1 phosphatidylglycerol:prolipoprotein diacylglycerol transferase [[Clostridium] paradoxum JW-YL-7 = DSM 7308]